MESKQNKKRKKTTGLSPLAITLIAIAVTIIIILLIPLFFNIMIRK